METQFQSSRSISPQSSVRDPHRLATDLTPLFSGSISASKEKENDPCASLMNP